MSCKSCGMSHRNDVHKITRRPDYHEFSPEPVEEVEVDLRTQIAVLRQELEDLRKVVNRHIYDISSDDE